MTEEKKRKKLKSLIRFHSANKIDSYNRGGIKGKKVQKNLKNKSKHKNLINVFLESLLSESFPLLGVTVHLTTLGCPPTLCWFLDLLWGQLRFYSGPTLCSCLQYPQLSELVCFLLWELLMTFYIFCRHRVCLVDCAGLICSLYSWWQGFGSSSFAALPLSFDCGFISTSACGLPTGVCSWGCPGALGPAPVRARFRGGAAL